MKKIVPGLLATGADAPYSPAVFCGSLLFVSGQVPLDPETSTIITGSFTEEAEQALRNLGSILEKAGSSLEKVVKTTVFLSAMENLPEFNAVYVRFFPEYRPARSCIVVSGLPFDARVEIEAIATL